MKTSEEIRQAFLDFWSESPRNSKVVPNMSLVPNNDSTLLFVNSGMFPLVPYLAGQPHPLGKRIHNVQRVIRTIDIDDVGDNRHLVMFEMIGNWSLGDFTKEEQIPWCLELYVERFGLDPKRLYVTVWAGDEVVPRDDLAIELWKKAFAKYGVEAEFSEDITNIPKTLEEGVNHKARIFPYGRKENWWERGHAANELGGPSSEIFYDLGVKERDQEKYHINDDSGRFVEIGNNVFMEYRLDENLKYQPLEKKNIDFGGGFDRVIMAVQDQVDVYSTDLFQSMIQKIEELSGKTYKGGIDINEDTKSFRVVAEHIRSSVFILADGIKPSGKDQGYILRRLIRRMIRYAKKLGIENNFSKVLAEVVIQKMAQPYPHLEENRSIILDEIEKEEIKFRKTLNNGIKKMDDIWDQLKEISSIQHRKIDYLNEELRIDNKKIKMINISFYMYETFGFPYELFMEDLKASIEISRRVNDQNFNVFDKSIENKYEEEFKTRQNAHQEASRAGSEQKFKGGLADQSHETTKLHTAHHLLLAALQKVVDPNIKQRGSNITAERLRIDFNFDRKLTDEEIKKIEDLVNEKINEKLPVVKFKMKKEDAEKIGAQMEFGQKYPEMVTVYFVIKPLTKEQELESQMPMDTIIQYSKNPDESFVMQEQMLNVFKNNSFSLEFCGGPHVSNTSELAEGGKKFKILKEESSGAGIRRIKASLV